MPRWCPARDRCQKFPRQRISTALRKQTGGLIPRVDRIVGEKSRRYRRAIRAPHSGNPARYPGGAHRGSLVEARDFPAVFATIERAGLARAPVGFYTRAWNSVCWQASLNGLAQRAQAACEAAVAPDTTVLAARDSRGLARALAGNLKEATADFAYVVEHGKAGAFVDKRAGWLEALRAGKNPFTDQVLDELRKQRPKPWGFRRWSRLRCVRRRSRLGPRARWRRRGTAGSAGCAPTPRGAARYTPVRRIIVESGGSHPLSWSCGAVPPLGRSGSLE